MTDFVNEPFDDEERRLMEAVKSGETVKISGAELEAIRESVPGARNVTIRVQNSDIAGFKEKSRLAGIPYQTLMNSVLHRYLTGELVPRTAL